MTKQPKQPKPPKPPKGHNFPVRWCHHCNTDQVGTIKLVLAEHVVGDESREIEVLAWVCDTCGQPRFDEADE